MISILFAYEKMILQLIGGVYFDLKRWDRRLLCYYYYYYVIIIIMLLLDRVKLCFGSQRD